VEAVSDVKSCLLIIIISAERRPMLDIGLPQSSPRRSVLCCPHPAASRDLHQTVGPPCGGPTNAASPGTRSPFEDLSAPTAVSPPRNVPCPLPLEDCNSSGYVGDLSWIHPRKYGKDGILSYYTEITRYNKISK
jgi:hypothetical protein